LPLRPGLNDDEEVAGFDEPNKRSPPLGVFLLELCDDVSQRFARRYLPGVSFDILDALIDKRLYVVPAFCDGDNKPIAYALPDLFPVELIPIEAS